MRLEKFFILTLLATCPFYSAKAMEKYEEEYQKHISYNKVETKAPEEELYGQLNDYFNDHSPKNISIDSWSMYTAFEEFEESEGTPKDYRLFSLHTICGENTSQLEQNKKGYVVLWTLKDHLPNDSKSKTQARINTLYLNSLKALLIQWKEQNNDVYFMPSFGNSLKENLKYWGATEIPSAKIPEFENGSWRHRYQIRLPAK